MALYTIGDLHLSETAGKPMDVFGGVWRDYRQKIIQGFSRLEPEDVTVLCGDFSGKKNSGQGQSRPLVADRLQNE